jgi:hypothetical protein
LFSNPLPNETDQLAQREPRLPPLLDRISGIVPVLPSSLAAALEAFGCPRAGALAAVESAPTVRHRGLRTRVPIALALGAIWVRTLMRFRGHGSVARSFQSAVRMWLLQILELLQIILPIPKKLDNDGHARSDLMLYTADLRIGFSLHR